MSKALIAACALVAAPAFADVVAEPETLFLPPHRDEGCWVSFFSAPEFRGESGQLRGRSYVRAFETGPVAEPDLKAVGGKAFLREARSLVVGPHARSTSNGWDSIKECAHSTCSASRKARLRLR